MGCLEEAVESITTISVRNLQELSCDPAGAAVLNILLRILFNPALGPTDGHEGGVALGRELCAKILQWVVKESDEEDNDASADEGVEIVYQIAGNKVGSFFLECIIDSAPDALAVDIILRAIIRRKCTSSDFESSAMEFAFHSSANFVVQAALRRATAMVRLVGAGSVSDKKTAMVYVRMGKELLDILIGKKEKNSDDEDRSGQGSEDDVPEVTSQISRLCGSRGGVVEHMLTLAGALTNAKSDSSSIEALASQVARDVLSTWESVAGDVSTSADAHNEENVMLATYLARRMKPLPKPKKSEKPKQGERVVATATGGMSMNTQILLGKICGGIMRLGFHTKSKGSTRSSSSTLAAWRIASALSQLSGEIITYMACNGSLSKSVIDTFFELVATEHDSDSKETSSCSFSGLQQTRLDIGLALLAKIASSIATIGTDRVGQHCVRHAFIASDVRGKEMLAASGSEREMLQLLKRTQEGRNTIGNIHADVYERSVEDFHRLLVRQQKASNMVDELGALDTRGETAAPAPAPALASVSSAAAAAAAAAAPSSVPSAKLANRSGTVDWGQSSMMGDGDAKRKKKKDYSYVKGEDREPWMDRTSDERRRYTADSKKRKAKQFTKGANMHLVRQLNDTSRLGSAKGLLQHIEQHKRHKST